MQAPSENVADVISKAWAELPPTEKATFMERFVTIASFVSICNVYFDCSQYKDQLRYDMELTEWLEHTPEAMEAPKVGNKVRVALPCLIHMSCLNGDFRVHAPSSVRLALGCAFSPAPMTAFECGTWKHQ